MIVQSYSLASFPDACLHIHCLTAVQGGRIVDSLKQLAMGC